MLKFARSSITVQPDWMETFTPLFAFSDSSAAATDGYPILDWRGWVERGVCATAAAEIITIPKIAEIAPRKRLP
jgi:hypothetical protein